MWSFLSKFISAFSYGSGFILAIVCAVYAVNQYSNGSVRVASSLDSSSKSKSGYLEYIEIKNVSKLSDFTNYSNEGRKEEFIFTGELINNSREESYSKLIVEIDLYDSENKFIFKCGGWNGSGIEIRPQATSTFQTTCHRMPTEIATKYGSHKVVVKRQNF